MFTDRLTCACATHVVPRGEGVKADLENHRITRKPLRVLGYGNIRGIDLEHYARTSEVMADAAEIRNNDGFTFIFVGRLVGDKGINELIEAFSRLNIDYPNTRLILVGGQEAELDPLKPETLSEISHNKAIEDVGKQTDVRPWLAAADALVFPSYREGFPNVVIEAQAAGLPCLLSDVIDRQTDITGNIHFMSLSAPVLDWAKTMISHSAMERKDTFETIQQAGYDVNSNLRILTSLYGI